MHGRLGFPGWGPYIYEVNEEETQLIFKNKGYVKISSSRKKRIYNDARIHV